MYIKANNSIRRWYCRNSASSNVAIIISNSVGHPFTVNNITALIDRVAILSGFKTYGQYWSVSTVDHGVWNPVPASSQIHLDRWCSRCSFLRQIFELYRSMVVLLKALEGQLCEIWVKMTKKIIPIQMKLPIRFYCFCNKRSRVNGWSHRCGIDRQRLGFQDDNA